MTCMGPLPTWTAGSETRQVPDDVLLMFSAWVLLLNAQMAIQSVQGDIPLPRLR